MNLTQYDRHRFLEENDMDANFLKVWRLHPGGCKIAQAEKTLNNTANPGGVKWCAPYSTANRLGWWLWSPVDIDIVWKGGKDFDHDLLSPYPNTEVTLVRSLLRPLETDQEKFCPEPGGRSKFTWGAVDSGLVQIWTGCILETPPGWCLHMRSPVNCARQPYYVQEGVLETDWMQYDLWVNLQFTQTNTVVSLRRDQWPPLAQLVPIRREAFKEEWRMTEEIVNRDTPEANRVFEYWIDYNTKKYASGGKQALVENDPYRKKDSTTYYKERQRCLGLKGMEPIPEEVAPKPLPPKKRVPPFVKKPGGCPYGH